MASITLATKMSFGVHRFVKHVDNPGDNCCLGGIITMATIIVLGNHNGNLVCITMISCCIVKCYYGNHAGM